MFGVDKAGRDVLAPQFAHKKVPGYSAESATRSEYQHKHSTGEARRKFASLEDEMAFGSERRSVEKNTEFMSTTRRAAIVELSRALGREAQETEIRAYIEREIDRVTMERVERMKKIVAEMAGRAVLRTEH